MIFSDAVVSKFQAYIIYGKNIQDILRRIVSYLKGCSNAIADTELRSFLDSICANETPLYVELREAKDIEEVVAKYDLGKGLLFRVLSPRDDVYAIAFIPINKYNKDVVLKGRR